MSKLSEEDLSELKKAILPKFHALLLEALRQREQDVIRYIAILAPALGGYIWLLHNVERDSDTFIFGTLGVLSLLLIGAVYSAALGYNYRIITFQLAKFECKFGIKDFVLCGWPRTVEVFKKRYGTSCAPPTVINAFRWSFILTIIGVGLSASHAASGSCLLLVFRILGMLFPLFTPLTFRMSACQASGGSCLILVFSILATIFALFTPLLYGYGKFRKLAEDEPEWSQVTKNTSGNNS